MSPTACIGRSIDSDAVSKARERSKRSLRHGEDGALKSQLSLVGRETVDIGLPIQQNLDGSILVIYNTPCNTIITYIHFIEHP